MVELSYQEARSGVAGSQFLDRAFDLLFEEVIKSYPQILTGNYEQFGVLYQDEIYDQR